MRIVHCITKGDVGGAQAVVEALTREQLRDHRVDIATGLVGPMCDALRVAGATIHHVPQLVHAPDPRRDRAATGALAGLFGSVGADIVHCHSSKGGLVGRFAARRAGIPAVYTAHGWPFQTGGGAGRRVGSFMGEFVAGHAYGDVVCVSEADFARALAWHVVPAQRLHRIPNGIAPVKGYPPKSNASSATWAHGLGCPGADRVDATRLDANRLDANRLDIVMVARFAAPKRQDLALRSVALAEHVRLSLIGDGPGLEAARRLSIELGIADRVRFLSGETDVPGFLATADALIHLSDVEGLPIAVIEAFRAGLPVVANTLPGTVELIGRKGERGILTSKDPIAIAAALRGLGGDERLRERLGAASFSYWRDQLTAERMWSRYAELYARVCGA